MGKHKIFIGGEETEVELTEIETAKILFDARNPRIGMQSDMTESLDQTEIEFYLERKNVSAFERLKTSIKENKGIMNPIWLIQEENKYTALEGNTRLLIYKQLHESEKKGDKYFSKIKAYVIQGPVESSKEDFIRLTAHLRGETEWDAYEKSRYLFLLNDKGYSVNRLEDYTKLKKNDIINNINAFKLMQDQFLPKYGKEPSDVFKFSFFVEYVKDKKLQNLMEKNNLKDKNFCSWVASNKIKRAMDVRNLKKILAHERVKDQFIKKGYDAAIEKLSIINPSQIKGIYNDIEQLIDDLGTKINPDEISEMKANKDDSRRKLIKQLKTKIDMLIELID